MGESFPDIWLMLFAAFSGACLSVLARRCADCYAAAGRVFRSRGRLSARVLAKDAAAGLAFAVVFAALFAVWGASAQALVYAALLWLLGTAALIDARLHIIPNAAVVAVAVLWAATVWLLAPPLTGFGPGAMFAPVLGCTWLAVAADALAGGFVVGGGVLLVSLAFEKLRGAQSLGGGDVKLLFATSLHLGLVWGLSSLFLACVIGVALACAGKAGMRGSVAFGPAIALATAVVLVAGPLAAEWRIGLFL